MDLLSINYQFWSILAVFLCTFFIAPPNTKKKCITNKLRSVRTHWYHFHACVKNFFFFIQNGGFQSVIPLLALWLDMVHFVAKKWLDFFCTGSSIATATKRSYIAPRVFNLCNSGTRYNCRITWHLFDSTGDNQNLIFYGQDEHHLIKAYLVTWVSG